MTMNTGLARALRRFVGGSAVMLTGVTGLRHVICDEIRIPPTDVDRVVVTSPDGRSHEITNRAAVAGIVRQVRSVLDGALSIKDRAYNPNLRSWGVALHRGAEEPDRIGLVNQFIYTQGAIIWIDTEESLDLHRLLGATSSPVSPPAGERA